MIFVSVEINMCQKQRSYNLYTLAEGIMIPVRSLQRGEGDVSNPIKYIN